MGRNIRGRLGKLEQEAPPQTISWDSLITGNFDAFITSLPDYVESELEPPQPAPDRDHVEDRIRSVSKSPNHQQDFAKLKLE